MRQIAARLGVSKNVIWIAMKREGIPRHSQHSLPGAHNPAWKGGRCRDNDGYWLIYAPQHPHATKAGYVREHRLVIEKRIGRYLLPEEAVDHIDGDRGNNDPANLRVFQKNADHLRTTLKGRVPKWTPEGQEKMAQATERARRRAKPKPEPKRSPETREKQRQAALRREARKRAAILGPSGNGAPSSPVLIAPMPA